MECLADIILPGDGSLTTSSNSARWRTQPGMAALQTPDAISTPMADLRPAAIRGHSRPFRRLRHPLGLCQLAEAVAVRRSPSVNGGRLHACNVSDREAAQRAVHSA